MAFVFRWRCMWIFEETLISAMPSCRVTCSASLCDFSFCSSPFGLLPACVSCSVALATAMPASPLQLAKRAFVAVLLALAVAHNIAVEVSRDSPDDAVRKAFRKVCVKPHPDKGGSLAEQQRLNAAKEACDAALGQGARRGRPRKAAGRRAAGRAGAQGGAHAQGAAAVPKKSQTVAKNCVLGLRKVCQEVARKRGAMARS